MAFGCWTITREHFLPKDHNVCLENNVIHKTWELFVLNIFMETLNRPAFIHRFRLSTLGKHSNSMYNM